jgi:hypothetical protein
MMEMITLYLEQTPELIGQMKKSMQDEDWESLHAAVHKMIPSFSIMGINKNFEAMAKKLQEYNGTKTQGLPHTQEIQELVLQLENVCTLACTELEEEYTTLKNTKA